MPRVKGSTTRSLANKVDPNAGMGHCLHMSADTQPPSLANETAEAAAESLSLLADETRLKILWALMHSEQSVNALAAIVGAKAPAVSQHLSKLRLAGMVAVRREGTYAYYRACDDHISRMVNLLVEHTSEELAAQAKVNALLAETITQL